MKKRNGLTNLLILALCVLSGATSGLGLWWIFDQNTELLGASVVFAAAATTMLQALIVRFWDWAAAAPNWRRCVAAGLLGAFVSLASAGFAAGSYIYALNKSGVEAQLTQQNANGVMEPLSKFGGEMRAISLSVLDMSNEARHESSVESSVGGTCVGDKAEEKCGPRCRLRKRHAQEAEGLSTTLRSLATKADGIMGSLQADQTREGMLRAFSSARDLASHPDLSKVSSWLRQEIAGFNGQFLDPDTKRLFVCRDPRMVKGMGDALSLITKGFDLPSVPPEPVKIGFREAIAKSYQDAFELAKMVLTGRIDPVRHQALSYSYGGYAPALAVEFLIVALVFFRRFAEDDRGGGWRPEDIYAGNPRDLPPALGAKYRAWSDLILSMMLEERKMWYFARPIDGAPEIVRQCTEAAIILELPLDPDMKPAIPLKDLYPEWVESRSGVHGGARWFALHPLTPEKRDWLRRAARDLADMPAPQPSSPPPDPRVVGGTETDLKPAE